MLDPPVIALQGTDISDFCVCARLACGTWLRAGLFHISIISFESLSHVARFAVLFY